MAKELGEGENNLKKKSTDFAKKLVDALALIDSLRDALYEMKKVH